MELVRVGVVGTGRMGRNHCRVFSTLRHVDLAGIYDPDTAVANRVAGENDTCAFRTIDDLLEGVDAVSMATPTPTHFPLAMHCLKRGKHLLIEKPIAETEEQAEKLVSAADASGLIVQVGHIERFNPAYAELKNVLLDSSPLVVNFRRLSPYVGSNTDVDVISDLMIHDLDLVLDLMGRVPVTVEASGLTAVSGAIDHVVAQMQFAHGPLVCMTASRVTESKIRCIEITAQDRFIVGNLLDKSVAVHRRTYGQYVNQGNLAAKYRQESVVESIHVPATEPLWLELHHFIYCIRERCVPAVTAHAGWLALRLATQVREAVNQNLLVMGRSLHPRVASDMQCVDVGV